MLHRLQNLQLKLQKLISKELYLSDATAAENKLLLLDATTAADLAADTVDTAADPDVAFAAACAVSNICYYCSWRCYWCSWWSGGQGYCWNGCLNASGHGVARREC